MLGFGGGGKGEGRVEGGKESVRERLEGREDMVGRVMRDGPVELDMGEEASVFFAKQIKHFPPKIGFCSFSRLLPHSAKKHY